MNALLFSMFGIGGLTIRKLQFDLHLIKCLKPQIIILEIGTNDLSHTAPKIVVKNLVKFLRLLLDEYSTHVVGGLSCDTSSWFLPKC